MGRYRKLWLWALAGIGAVSLLTLAFVSRSHSLVERATPVRHMDQREGGKVFPPSGNTVPLNPREFPFGDREVWKVFPPYGNV